MKLCCVLALVAFGIGGPTAPRVLAAPAHTAPALSPLGIYLLIGGSWVDASTFCFFDDGHIFRFADNALIGTVDAEDGSIRDAEGNLIGMVTIPQV